MYKLFVLAAVLTVANAGYLGAPAVATYAAAPAVSYAAPAVSYAAPAVSYAAPAAVAYSPAAVVSHVSFAGLGAYYGW